MSPDDPAAAPLVNGLLAEYRVEYADLLDGEFELYDPAEFAPPCGAFVVARDGGETVAGGALRRLEDGVGEIKRMWTAPGWRGRGYGRRVLDCLETLAIGFGYRSVRLETATPQTAALALYRSAGYVPVEPYGRYAGDSRFLYLAKAL